MKKPASGRQEFVHPVLREGKSGDVAQRKKDAIEKRMKGF